MTAKSPKPKICVEGHEPIYEIECETPDVFVAVWNWPPTITYHVCADCHNSKQYFQKFAIRTVPLPGVKITNTEVS